MRGKVQAPPLQNLNCPELWLGVVWNSIHAVLRKGGGEAFLEALGVDIMY